MKNIILKLKEKTAEDFGENRADELEQYLINKLKEYSEVLNLPEVDILNAWEKERKISIPNFYQDCNQPSLKEKKNRVFDSVNDLRASIGEMKFRCPYCKGISTNPYECNSKVVIKKSITGISNDICDWKVYGLFGDLGEGVFVYCKDKMVGEKIFKPLAWEE